MGKHTRKKIVVRNLNKLIKNIMKLKDWTRKEAIKKGLEMSTDTIREIEAIWKATTQTTRKLKEKRDFFKDKSGDSTAFDLKIEMDKEYKQGLLKELKEIRSILNNIEKSILSNEK